MALEFVTLSKEKKRKMKEKEFGFRVCVMIEI